MIFASTGFFAHGVHGRYGVKSVPTDVSKPRNGSTECGNQSADQSLINRRLDAFVPNLAQVQTHLIPAPQHADGLAVFLRSPRSATLGGDERS
jgi:hypothetical protein